jgi:His-Xaa-Ser system radical SAM maturase HxsC
MCSQPPSSHDDIEHFYKKNVKIIESAPKELPSIGITGGEPTLLGTKLFDLFELISLHLPDTLIHVLTNGRMFSQQNYARTLANGSFTNLLFGIPIHSDYQGDHDRITQIHGSFSETMKGLYNLGKSGFDIELRVVITRSNSTRLPELANFIYRNLPFVRYVSFMGLEYTGWLKKNHHEWIDPTEYQEALEKAVTSLANLGMMVSVFNVPLCLLSTRLHPYACKSISDWKVYYESFCDSCGEKEACCGLFTTSKIQSKHLHPINML